MAVFGLKEVYEIGLIELVAPKLFFRGAPGRAMMLRMAFSDVKTFCLSWRMSLLAVVVALLWCVPALLGAQGTGCRDKPDVPQAIAQLEDTNLAIRLCGIEALGQLAKDSEKDHGPILEALTAYVRERAPRQGDFSPTAAQTPPPDIQAILTVIGRRATPGSNRRDARLDLRNTHLAGVVIPEADLRGASLRGASLNLASLSEATLRRADLNLAKLRGADPARGRPAPGHPERGHPERGRPLSEAALSEATLSGADLSGATLSGATLREADLSGAYPERGHPARDQPAPGRPAPGHPERGLPARSLPARGLPERGKESPSRVGSVCQELARSGPAGLSQGSPGTARLTRACCV